MAFSPDGRQIAVGAGDGIASLWLVSDGGLRLVHRLGHKSTVSDVASAPMALAYCSPATMGRHECGTHKTGSPVSAEMKHGKLVFHAEFSPDGKRVVTASYNGTGRVWDARTGQPITPGSGTIGHAIAVREACFSPDGGRVATAGYDGAAACMGRSDRRAPFSAAFSRRSVSPGPVHSRRLARLDGRLGRDRPALERDDHRSLGDHRRARHRRQSGCFRPGRQAVCDRVWQRIGPGLGCDDRPTGHAGNDSPAAEFAAWRFAAMDGCSRPAASMAPPGSGTRRPAWRSARRLVHKDTVVWAAFSPDDLRLATASADGTARIWDVASGQPIGDPLQHKNEVVQVVYSPDGSMLATASMDGTARIWDAVTGSPLFPPIVHETEVSCVAFHPAGRLLLTACSDNSLNERAAQQWEIATGKPVGPPFKHGDGVLWATYSPDGTRVATASEDMTARVWDATTGAPVTRPLRHRHWIGSVEFSPDGRRLATCSDDGTARVWDAATGEALAAPFLHQDQKSVSSATFRADGRAVLTAGQDGTVRCWDLPVDGRSVDALITEAQVRAGRRIDQTGGEVPLSATELAGAWAQLHGDARACWPIPGRSRGRWENGIGARHGDSGPNGKARPPPGI